MGGGLRVKLSGDLRPPFGPLLGLLCLTIEPGKFGVDELDPSVLDQPARCEVARWQTTANNARQEAARLRALPPQEAARQITEKRTAAETARQTAAERARRLRSTPQEPATTRDPGRDGPDLRR